MRAGIRVRTIGCRARDAHAWRDRGRRPPGTRGLTTARNRSLRRSRRRLPRRYRSLRAACWRRNALGSLPSRLGGNRRRRPNWISRRRHVWIRRRRAGVWTRSRRRGSSRIRYSCLRRSRGCRWRRSCRRCSARTLSRDPTCTSKNCDKRNKPFCHGIHLDETPPQPAEQSCNVSLPLVSNSVGSPAIQRIP